MKDLSKIFVAALKDAIKDGPWGVKTRLAKEAGISTGMLGDILAERAYGTEETKRALAAALGFPGAKYEKFLDIGRAIQAGKPISESAPLDSNTSEPFLMVKVPLFDAGAGEPSEFYLSGRAYDLNDNDDFIYVTEHEAKMKAFGVKVHGDSMAPTIEQGDIVVVLPTRAIENGKIVLVCWPSGDGDAGKRMVKRYKADSRGNIVLYSDNNAHEPIILDRKKDKDVRLFRVVKLIKDL